MSAPRTPAVSKPSFTTWPSAIAHLLDGDLTEPRLAEKLAFTVALITVDAASRPITTLLGVGEMLVTGPGEMRLAIWAGSRAATQIGRDGRATLTFVHDGSFYQVHLRVDADAVSPDWPGLIFYSARIDAAEAQAVTYARLLSGITFELPAPQEVLPRWKAQLEVLRNQHFSKK